MGNITALAARYPYLELNIRRLCCRDVKFKAVCEDYEEAADALRHWQGVAGEGDAKVGEKVGEYEEFLAELEVEILSYLNPQP